MWRLTSSYTWSGFGSSDPMGGESRSQAKQEQLWPQIGIVHL